MNETLKVSIPGTKRDYFDYLKPEFKVPIGSRVWVPFGKKQKLGIVVALGASDIPSYKLKAIESLIDETPLLSEDMLALSHWVSRYYQSPLSEVLALVLPKKLRLGAEAKVISVHATPTDKSAPLSLNPEQALALRAILENLHHYKSFLLQGVTGSGKTEIYLQAIAVVLADNKQALVIVPEIGLTPQLVARFESRFQESIGIMHSQMTDKSRGETWLRAALGELRIVIGTRTAIFTPMPRLGLIVVDEEHDASFKQMDGVRYSAKDTALMRANRAGIPIVLGTATPSLESLYNVDINKHERLVLNQKAESVSSLYYQMVDLRNQALQEGLSRESVVAITEHLNAGHQVLVFINRRGFSPVLLCHACAFMVDCEFCDSHLTFHQQAGVLLCHHCGASKRTPKACPHCHSKELVPIGTGTQRVYEYLTQLFPDTPMIRMDRDEIRTKKHLDAALRAIQSEKVKLIVGTQMLAKGHHFPKLTLVVVLDADSGLFSHDFRALERLGQLLTQVSGRAGRAERPGHVLIQTHAPSHPLLNCLIQEGYEAFARHLLPHRQAALLPPYQFVALLRAQGKRKERVSVFLEEVKGWLIQANVQVLGPAPAPLARKAGFHRLQLFIKSPSRSALNASLDSLRQWIVQEKKGSSIQWALDVDPVEVV